MDGNIVSFDLPVLSCGSICSRFSLATNFGFWFIFVIEKLFVDINIIFQPSCSEY